MKQSEMVAQKDYWAKSVCKMCIHTCAIRAHVVDGVVVKIEGDPDNPGNRGKLCPKGQAGINRLYDPHRVKTPLKRTNPEKGVGVDPKWVPISWEEALSTTAEKLKAIREDDPRKLLVSINDFHRIHIWGWGSAFGSPHYFSTVGQYCGAAYHPTNGILDGAFAAINDYDHCKYWIQIGAGDGFSAHLHLASSIKRMADARVERGMKLVVVEPRMSAGAAKADEWIATRPGTDRAFVLGMVYTMLYELNVYDAGFMRKYTNGIHLVQKDGNLLRNTENNKAMVWDTATDQARDFDAEMDIQDMALEGSYQVNGIECRPAFQVIKDSLADHTPERMSEICSVSAETIRRIAKEYSDAACIGSNITLDGTEYPYRPAAVNYYRGAIGHVDGGLDALAMKLVNLIVGNIDVPGGHLGVGLNHQQLIIEEGQDGMMKPQPHLLHPPGNFSTKPDSFQMIEWYPIGIDPGHLCASNIMDPDHFGYDYQPEALIIEHSNPMWNLSQTPKVKEVFKKLKFIVAIDIVLNESSDWADIVLPDLSYLESDLLICIESPMVTGYFYRRPVIKPLYDGRDATDILSDLAERIGFLPNWNGLLNFTCFLAPEYHLDPDKVYTNLELTDRMAKSIYGPDQGLEWFQEHGHATRLLRPDELYMSAAQKGLRIPIYFNFIKEVGEDLDKKMKAAGREWDTSSYLPVPIWRDSHPLHNVDPEYDMYAFAFKEAQSNFSESTTMPWIEEVISCQPIHLGVMINGKTAQTKGIKTGDVLKIESPFGEVKGLARVTEEVHPECIAISNTISRWSRHPVGKQKITTHFNQLLPSDVKWTDGMTGHLETATRVKLSVIAE